jgi:hypothetical protein
MDTPESTVMGAFWKEWWEGRIKPLGDFRAFLKQRRKILTHPETVLDPPRSEDKKWRSPLHFGFQGMAVLTFLIGTLSWVGARFITAPDFQALTDARAKRQLDDFKVYRQAIAGSPVDKIFYFQGQPESRDEALARQDTLIRHVEHDAWVLDKTNEIFGRMFEFLNPIPLLLSAYLFRVFVGKGLGGSAPNRSKADAIYLYCLTSYSFYPNLCVAAFLGVIMPFMGKANRQGGPLILDHVAWVVAFLFAMTFWSWIVAREAAPVIQHLLGIEDRAGKLNSGRDKVLNSILSSAFVATALFYAAVGILIVLLVSILKIVPG